MSLVINNTTSKNGIIQRIEKTCGFNDGDISGNTTLLAQFIGDVNCALDRALALIFQVGGTWQFDDSNHTDYPIITTNLVSGQRDYPFVTDGNSNLTLEVHEVLVADSAGIFRKIQPVDAQTNSPTGYYDGLNVTGQPNTYDKTASSIFLDPPANYNYTNGLKLYISREGSYFSTSDTTKKPGIAGLFHEYFVLYPSLQYAIRSSLSIKNDIGALVTKMEADMQEYYAKREKDVRKQLTAVITSSR